MSRKKAKPEKRDVPSESNDSSDSGIKFPAKRKQQKVPVSRNFQSNVTVKIRLLSATTTTTTNTANIANIQTGPVEPFNYQLPLTPPPTDDLVNAKTPLLTSSEWDDVTVLIDNTTPTVVEEKVINVPDVGIYEFLSEKNVDWCRYCGVAGDTGTFWKLGPWGDRTLCHKHGCEFFGCGFARVTRTRLDLTEFHGEKRAERKQPIISEFCSICWERKDSKEAAGEFLQCHGCPLSFHKSCLDNNANENRTHSHTHTQINGHFFCTEKCAENFENCLIRPQFPSKANFPFYRQILLPEPLGGLEPPSLDHLKLRINIKQQPLQQQPSHSHASPSLFGKKQRRKYRKQQIENQSDRVIAFMPIKVDHSVHYHETIKTPQWTKISLQERMEALTSASNITDSPCEELNDQLLSDRHARYEHVEKTTRLLKPGVLEQLISGQL